MTLPATVFMGQSSYWAGVFWGTGFAAPIFRAEIRRSSGSQSSLDVTTLHGGERPRTKLSAEAARGSPASKWKSSSITATVGRTRRPSPRASSLGSGHIRSRVPGWKYEACEPFAT